MSWAGPRPSSTVKAQGRSLRVGRNRPAAPTGKITQSGLHCLVPDSIQPLSAQFKLTATSDALPSNDQRWRNQVDGLLGDLKRNAGEVRREITPVAGQKGGAEAIILALGSSGAITASIAIFKAWLSRAADRTIEIDGTIGGRQVKLKLTGQNIDEKTLRLALGLVKE